MYSLMREEACSAAERVGIHLTENEQRYRDLAAMLRHQIPASALTIARGSSDHAASYFSYLSAVRGGHIVTSLPMSLMTLYDVKIAATGLLGVSVSQSGRSPDLITPMTRLRSGGAHTIALVNDTDSPLASAAEWVLPLCAGEEKSVAATKTFICSLVGAAKLVAAWCNDRGLTNDIESVPEALHQALKHDWSSGIEALTSVDRIMVIGRGTGLSIAQEAALKFKETCGIQAEAFSAAEVKHGPMALVDRGYLMLIFAPRGPAQSSLLALAEEMRGRGARVLLAAPDQVRERDLTLATTASADLDPIAAIQSFYLMVESVARARGYNPDEPRHLSKVTSTL